MIIQFKRFTFTLILVLFVPPYLIAQPGQANEKRVSDTSGGYSFGVPNGFESKQNEEGFGLVNKAQTVIVAVKSHNFRTFDEFAAQANIARDGFTLIGKVQDVGETGKTFLTAKQSGQEALLANTFVMFSPFGGGTLVVAFSNQANNDASFQTAFNIAKSLKYTKPQESAESTQWQNALRGKHLLYFYTASGFSERTDIYLCSSGSFIYRSNSSSVSANGTGGAQGGNSGTWKTSSRGSLILQFQNGSTREYKLSRRQVTNEIGLNGNRYFVQSHNQCQ